MKTIALSLIGETAEWESTNPVLLKGMIGVEILKEGKRRIKIGDGKSSWKDPNLKALNAEDIDGLRNELNAKKQEYQSLHDLITEEARVREQTDQTLQQTIDDKVQDLDDLFTIEAETRAETDQKLQNAINTEAQAREQADESLLNSIAGEELYRTQDDQNLQEQIDNEIQARAQGDIDSLNAAKNYADQKAADLSSILYGVQALTLSGALLTRVINGTTPVAKNLFDLSTVFIVNKTLINDANGTIGACWEQDSATIIVRTLSISPISTTEATLIGNVSNHASLPLTVEEATARGWPTPKLNDWANVNNDETLYNQKVEWYVTLIDAGNITWGNHVIINASDYQAQTTAQDAGKMLVGGATPGTFGASLGIDNTPTNNSANLINSNAVYNALDIMLAMTTNTDTDTSTGAVSGLIKSVLQTIWNKIRSVVNAIIAHTGNTNNPHNVTKSQVGLGNVSDIDTTDAFNVRTTLGDYSETATLPTLTSNTSISTLLQRVRDNLKYLFNNKLDIPTFSNGGTSFYIKFPNKFIIQGFVHNITINSSSTQINLPHQMGNSSYVVFVTPAQNLIKDMNISTRSQSNFILVHDNTGTQGRTVLVLVFGLAA